jgi:hypothetical protein
MAANVDTDVIIPARHLSLSEPKDLAKHCMEDIDAEFVKKVKPGDIIVAELTWLRFFPGTCSPRYQSGRDILRHRFQLCPHFFIAML